MNTIRIVNEKKKPAENKGQNGKWGIALHLPFSRSVLDKQKKNEKNG